jgi:nickel-dependent lactate racemase
MMTLPGAMLGHFDDNPARQDVEEMGRMLKVDLALNAILNDHKKIVQVLAGEPTEVMRLGMPRVRELYVVEVDEPFDLVIASPGGHPKDINVYQAQKGLAHASLITRTGGEIVLAAACPEGSGSKSYEEWVSSRRSHDQVLEDFEAEGFRIGPHKAFQIAREATRFRTTWVTDMAPREAERLLLDTASSIDEAVAAVRMRHPEWAPGGSAHPRVAIMPVANATIAGVGGAGNAGGEPAR